MHPVRRLVRACSRSDVTAVEACLAAGVTAVCDGGGVADVPAGPVHGAGEVAALLSGLLGRGSLTVESVNGEPGIVVRSYGGTACAVVAAGCSPTEVTALWLVLNPAKLTRWHRRDQS
ncbi:MAG: siderophore-interacting protein [Actinomycetota bacterium]|nr:siderophore-interacting protein [Actinomycetota bacterium]